MWVSIKSCGSQQIDNTLPIKIKTYDIIYIEGYILLKNEVDNIPSRNMREKLGAELTDIDEHCHY